MAKKTKKERLINRTTYVVETLLHRMTLGREENFSTPIFLHARDILPQKNMSLNPTTGLELPIISMLPLELSDKVKNLSMKALAVEEAVERYNKLRLEIIDDFFF